MYKYLFGPVPSRRLGISLGIDLVPKKICTLDCVYCEVGKTTLLTTQRKEYIKIEKLKEELNHFFSNNPDPDYLTLSGSGEPTLNIHTGEIINYLKEIKPNIPIAVITNGTLLSDNTVRKELMSADVILPSLDAISQESFNKINRPEPSLKIEEYIQGIIEFRNEFKGEIWLEIFILPGYNDSKAELKKMSELLKLIKPNLIQLNTLDRPGTIDGIRAATEEELNSIANNIGLENIQIISNVKNRKNIQSYRKDIESTILETISRRPCTPEDLCIILGLHINELNKYLGTLIKDNRVETQQLQRGLFLKIKS